jgi:cysteine desulfurase
VNVPPGLPLPTGHVDAYLDHAASTPARPEVVEAMLPWLADRCGNPSGSHAAARAARRAVDESRDVLASLLGCAPGEVVFTSGGTEADDLAVNGVLDAAGGVAVCTAIEHHAVLDPVVHRGGVVVGVDACGVVDLGALADTLDAHRSNGSPPVTLVSVMLANNEVGTVQPLDAVCEVVARHSPGAAVHTDAVQAAAWCDVAALAAAVPLVSISGHKIGGPKGVGALAVRPGVPLSPRLRGGGQERGRRSGTQNVAGIVGLATAARLVLEQRAGLVARTTVLRDRLEAGLVTLPGVTATLARHGGPTPDRLASICHVCVAGVDSEALLFLLDDAGVAASAASSCASGATEPSHVLAAMGVPAEEARGSLRLSLGWTTDEATIEHALAAVPPAIERLRLFDLPVGGSAR